MQVKGSAKIMVTVVATKELEAGDVLRRFKAEATQDGPHDGNNNRMSSYALSVTYLKFL